MPRQTQKAGAPACLRRTPDMAAAMRAKLAAKLQIRGYIYGMQNHKEALSVLLVNLLFDFIETLTHNLFQLFAVST